MYPPSEYIRFEHIGIQQDIVTYVFDYISDIQEAWSLEDFKDFFENGKE